MAATGTIRAARRHGWAVHAALAVAIYPALLLTRRGAVAADSKQLLFVDAGRFLARAPYLWDPTIGMGTVTHQNIGYLLPMGPWFWATEQLGIPVWASQRLWLGTVMFAGGAGVLFLARTLRWSGPGPAVAALAYALSPFVLQYATHLSVLLLPYAALPWLVGCALRAARGRGWRWPAWFALVVALSGSVNATALVCVLVGPAVALVVEAVRRPDGRSQVLAAAGRLAALSFAVSLWWMVALTIESRYALDVLDFTESLETVTLASTAPEILRGLGYWFFYGRDPLTPYLDGAKPYMTSWVLPVSFAPVLLAVAAAFTIRWRRRALFVALLVVGTVLAAGAYPFDDPSPFGRLFKAVLEDFGPARAMRSITRITPLVVLAVAVLLGAGVTAALRHSVRIGKVGALVAVVAVLLSAGPLWAGDFVSGTRTRPEELPSYWRDAAARLDRGDHETRVLEVPGIDFAAYEWGYAHDSITRGLTDRPVVGREVVPYGTAGSVDLVDALDRRVQQGAFDAASLAPVARLMSARLILVRNDLRHERYGSAPPDVVRRALSPRPLGIGEVASYGAGEVPPLEILEITDVEPIVRGEPADALMVVAGSGDGIVDAAEASLLPDGRLIVYSGTLAGDRRAARRVLDEDPQLLVTDTNRRRAIRAKTLYDTTGYTERAREEPLRVDAEDARLDLFPDADDSAYSVTVVRGPRARATSYGNPLTLVPRDRPMLAVDGDPTTAWRVGDFWTVAGEQLEIILDEPVRADHVTILQPEGGNRFVTRARLTFDGGRAIEAELGRASRSAPGEDLRFPTRRFHRLKIEILASDPADRVNNGGLSGVGFAEVTIPGVEPAEELVRVPRDVFELPGTRSRRNALTFLFSRLRSGAPNAEEASLARLFELPTSRSFSVTGVARPVADGPLAPGCRADVLTIDGGTVPVALAAGADGALSLTACGGGSLTLEPGRHELRAVPGAQTGVDVDRVVLASAPGGGPGTGPSPSDVPAPPRARVTDRSPTSRQVDVRGVEGPFWLVLGESHSDGWRATIDGVDLGAPTLVDGAFNGWYVDPQGAATKLSVAFDWTPQRYVWIGLGISAVAIAGCIVLAFRRRVGWEPEPDTLLTLAMPRDEPRPAPARTTAVVTAAAALTAGVLGGLVPGVVVGFTTLAALRLRKGRLVPAAVALLALGASFVFIVVRELAERFPADFPWPASFDEVHTVALTGVLLLGVDVAVEWARRQHAGRRAPQLDNGEE